MHEAVTRKVKSAKELISKSGDQLNPKVYVLLRDAIKLILSRPNKDNMTSKLVPVVRSELTLLGAYQETMLSIANEAIHSINNEQNTPVDRATSVFILENLMSELKPDVTRKPAIKKIFERIRDAKIKLSSKVKNDRKVRGMFLTQSPSLTAKKILDSKFPKKDDE